MENKVLVHTDELSTKSKILLAAKREFFEKGFSNTSVRSIAEKSRVTTGALYNLFKNKDAIFEELVGDTFKKFLAFTHHKSFEEHKKYNMRTTELSELIEISRKRFLGMIEFYYENWDAMKLIICFSKGSSYEHIFDTAVESVEKETIKWLKDDNIKISKRTKFFIHVMVSSYFENITEIFHHNLKKSEAIQYVTDINLYHCAGWKQYWMEQIEENG